MKKIIVLLVLAAAGGWYGYRHWNDTLDERPQFRTLTIDKGDLLIGVSATGTVEPVQIVDVGAQILGSIKSFGPDHNRPGKTVDYGSKVKQGDILAQMDDLPYRAELDKATASLRLAEAEVKRYRSRKAQTEREFHRAEKLRDTNSLAEYENAMAEHEIAQADLAMSEARVEQATIVKKLAEINLSYTVIHSPVDGVVIDRRVNVGQTVVTGLNAPTLFLMAKDLSHMLVWAAVNEADIGDIHVGQRVTFKVDAYRDRTFTGKVSQIRLNAGLLQNVVTFGVVVDVDNPEGVLLPYMTAKLVFEVAHRENVLLVPNQALRWRPTLSQVTPAVREKIPSSALARRDKDKKEEREDIEPTVDMGTPSVWTLAEDGLVRPIAVKVGLSDGIVTELTSNEIKPKDQVVINVVREAKPDFVSSFILKVIKK